MPSSTPKAQYKYAGNRLTQQATNQWKASTYTDKRHHKRAE